MKLIIFDSSTIINLTMNGLLDILRKLHKEFNGKFIITDYVKYETIDHPMQIKKFELAALKVSRLLDEGILEMHESIGIDKEKIKEKTRELLNKVNRIFFAKNEFMHIIDEGEASCLVLSLIAKEKDIKSVIAIDERTTRMLGEKPENLHALFQKKLHTGIKMFRENLPSINKIRFIRSSELVYLAYKKNLVNLKNGRVLDALLYATKYKGCAISFQEIEEMKKL